MNEQINEANMLDVNKKDSMISVVTDENLK
jgi:poly(3-hydroxyalkanoate) synthetase